MAISQNQQQTATSWKFTPAHGNVLKRGSRSITVRLSEEEFLALRRVRSLTGARSVSELTREAVHPFLGDVSREDPIGLHLNEFRADMKSLGKKVEQLEAKITRQSGGRQMKSRKYNVSDKQSGTTTTNPENARDV